MGQKAFVLARNHGFVEVKGLNHKLKSFTKVSKLGDVVSKLVRLKRDKTPSCWAIFCNFWKK